MIKSLRNKTEKLKTHLLNLKQLYEDGRGDAEKNEFPFAEIKKETMPVFILIEQWEKEAIDWATDENMGQFIPQITSTSKTLSAILLHSYFCDIRARPYMSMHRSGMYTLNRLLEEINDA